MIRKILHPNWKVSRDKEGNYLVEPALDWKH